MPHRYFTTEISDGTATLRGADAHHLARVMRARLGDTVILCDGNAVEYTATITGFGDECVEFRVEPGYPSAAEPSVEVTLLAGYPKQDKLEQIIKHGVELGAAHIVPFSRYCVAAPKKEEQKNERYNRIAVEAAKQCGRGILPDVALPLANFGAVCRTFAQYDLVNGSGKTTTIKLILNMLKRTGGTVKVMTLPHLYALTLKHLARLDALDELVVALLVGLLDGGDTRNFAAISAKPSSSAVLANSSYIVVLS